jgi:hypothetical protein
MVHLLRTHKPFNNLPHPRRFRTRHYKGSNEQKGDPTDSFDGFRVNNQVVEKPRAWIDSKFSYDMNLPVKTTTNSAMRRLSANLPVKPATNFI